MMKRFVIERAIPCVGDSDLADASCKSNAVLFAMQAEGKKIQWETSYVTKDRTHCIYLVEDVALIHEHAKRSGFPATAVHEVCCIIDPTTGTDSKGGTTEGKDDGPYPTADTPGSASWWDGA
jgi:hypothetical protein